MTFDADLQAKSLAALAARLVMEKAYSDYCEARREFERLEREADSAFTALLNTKSEKELV